MLRKLTQANDPADWFAFAQERLHAADVLWNSDGLTFTGVECLQEAVERYLKGFLIARGWRLVKTRDLNLLVIEARGFDPAFGRFVEMAEKLTEQFFLQHYPGLDTTNVGLDYEKLREETAALVTMIQAALPSYFPNATQ